MSTWPMLSAFATLYIQDHCAEAYRAANQLHVKHIMIINKST